MSENSTTVKTNEMAPLGLDGLARTDASIVRVFEGGKLGVGAGSPLNVAVTSEIDISNESEPVNVLNLEDIRAATARALEPTGSENSENKNPPADDQLNQNVPSSTQPQTG